MSEWTPPEQVWVACDGMHWSVRATPTAGEFVPYVPESRLAEVASKARELQWVAAKYGEPADLATERDALRERLAAVERERDEAFALVASTGAENVRLQARLTHPGEPKEAKCEHCGLTRWEGKQVTGYVDALRARVEELEAALREAEQHQRPKHPTPYEEGYADAMDALAALAGGSREEPRSDTTCKHLINCGEGCGCDEPEPRPDTRGPFLPGKWKLGVQAARERAEEDELPYHLRADAPPLAECDVCGRKTWDEKDADLVCKMPRPAGSKCQGWMITRPAARPDTTKEDRER